MNGLIYVPFSLSVGIFLAVKDAVSESIKKKDGKLCERVKNGIFETVKLHFTTIS